MNPKLWGAKPRRRERKMSDGFDVKVEMPREDIDKLLKKYKGLKKYQKSNLFAIKTIDGTEDVISKMVQEVEDDPI